MKVLKVKEEIINITWEQGKKAKLYAVVYSPWGSHKVVIAVFDNEYWASFFILNSAIKPQLEVMEVVQIGRAHV